MMVDLNLDSKLKPRWTNTNLTVSQKVKAMTLLPILKNDLSWTEFLFLNDLN